MTIKIDALHRYPVKGLSGESLRSVQLETGQGFPCDRIYGFSRPDSGFDPRNPKPLPKSKFYMLARDEKLVLLSTKYNENTGVLSISSPNDASQFDITTAIGKQDASMFLKKYLSLPEQETPKLFEASPHRFTDVSVISSDMMNAVSIINLESVKEFSTAIGQEVDPMRFRGNIYVSGMSPFSELSMIGKSLVVGETHFKIVQRTKRCPATEVDLQSGERNIDVRKLLQQHYDHKDLGVYAQVENGGVISQGDTLEIL